MMQALGDYIDESYSFIGADHDVSPDTARTATEAARCRGAIERLGSQLARCVSPDIIAPPAGGLTGTGPAASPDELHPSKEFLREAAFRAIRDAIPNGARRQLFKALRREVGATYTACVVEPRVIVPTPDADPVELVLRGMLMAILETFPTADAVTCLAGPGRSPIKVGKLFEGRASVTEIQSSIEEVFAFDPRLVRERHLFISASNGLPWAKFDIDSRRSRRPGSAIVMFIQEGDCFYGLAGVEARSGRGIFDAAEIGALSALERLFLAAAQAPVGSSKPSPKSKCSHLASGLACKAACVLSPREREIVELLASGYTSTNIAAHLELSANTIRTHIKKLYAKLGVFNRADLVRKWLGPE
jgi:DNA-binding CsgD family transcriptional regulator